MTNATQTEINIARHAVNAINCESTKVLITVDQFLAATDKNTIDLKNAIADYSRLLNGVAVANLTIAGCLENIDGLVLCIANSLKN